ncbi:hypothetical protein K437DRAFT_257845 [Tilletiaria anomala UBC 951]|uniref:Uncharacterized protein n=1 Tax=Tilletiaria anomala (strain ATCC 24038 / CBS 436.72 / UBC 951) TaxID=1037660 RepID=A0A066VVC4_TILAU|nr:uncharacterized protein K437DRAFT_257845 [Tilletiaria anomala UBC 951]KDN42505.1 hypothetical protein K437DRAFT_257845 [Tilletiaria anomala UBC 951]
MPMLFISQAMWSAVSIWPLTDSYPPAAKETRINESRHDDIYMPSLLVVFSPSIVGDINVFQTSDRVKMSECVLKRLEDESLGAERRNRAAHDVGVLLAISLEVALFEWLRGHISSAVELLNFGRRRTRTSPATSDGAAATPIGWMVEMHSNAPPLW